SADALFCNRNLVIVVQNKLHKIVAASKIVEQIVSWLAVRAVCRFRFRINRASSTASVETQCNVVQALFRSVLNTIAINIKPYIVADGALCYQTEVDVGVHPAVWSGSFADYNSVRYMRRACFVGARRAVLINFLNRFLIL